LFQTGKVAMAIDGCWAVRFIKENSQIDFGTSTVPVSKDYPELTGLNTIDYNPHFIPVGAKNIKEAWDFLKYMIMDPEIAARFADASANLSQLKQVSTKFTSELFEDKNYLVFAEAAAGPNCIVHKAFPMYNEMSVKLFTVQETVLMVPNSDIRTLLKQAGDEINAQL
jgi:maltose-binding protein MalE